MRPLASLPDTLVARRTSREILSPTLVASVLGNRSIWSQASMRRRYLLIYPDGRKGETVVRLVRGGAKAGVEKISDDMKVSVFRYWKFAFSAYEDWIGTRSSTGSVSLQLTAISLWRCVPP